MPSDSALAGDWVGSFRETGKAPRHLRVEFSTAGDLVSLRAMVRSVSPVISSGTATLEGGAVSVELERAHPLLRLRGKLNGNTIKGAIELAHASATFQIRRMAGHDPALYEECSGTYDLDDRGTVFVRKGVRLSWDPPYAVERSWLYFVMETGVTRILFPRSTSMLDAGPALLIPDPVQFGIDLVRDKRAAVTSLRWRERGTPERSAPRTQRYSEHDVWFRSDSLTIAGRLLLPAGPGPHPGVVLIPGGPGPSDRDDGYLIVGHLLALHGIAALVTDKRGCGRSEGDWRVAMYDDFAQDALAAVAYLRSRTEIDPARVGLFGISEGAWIAPLAAASSADISFVVLVGASAMSHQEADVLAREAMDFGASGLSAPEVDALRAFDDQVIAFATSGSGWDSLRPRIAGAALERWYPFSVLWTHTRSSPPDSPDHWFWRLYGSSAEHDPGAALRALRVPLLAIWGEHDTAAPPRQNVELMKEYLDQSGCTDHTLRVIVGGDHTLWQVDGPDPSDFQLVRTFVPEYFALLTRWIEERVLARPTAT